MPPPTASCIPTPAKTTTLPDIQKTPDTRGVLIEKVGVKAVRQPVRVADLAENWQHTIATVNMYVELPATSKGTHMSRFVELLNERASDITPRHITWMLDEMCQRLNARTAYLEMDFPYFIRREAPVTGGAGWMEYRCGFTASRGAVNDMVVRTVVPVATLCPCSREISDRGAHNQRGDITIRVRSAGLVWFEELIHIAEQAGSCALYPVLKRPDEKYVTEFAYDHPRFVEDVLRETAVALQRNSRVDSFEVEVENFESIHAHNAYASTSSGVMGR